MRYTHPLDRLFYRLRWPIVGLGIISAPICVYSYGKMMVLAYETWSGLAFALTAIAHLVTLCAVASVFDSQQERRQLTESEQSEARRRP